MIQVIIIEDQCQITELKKNQMKTQVNLIESQNLEQKSKVRTIMA